MGLEQYIAPNFRLSLNGNSEHNLIVNSINFIDYEKDNVDILVLNLSINSYIPAFKDRIELFLGRNNYYFMGAFYVSSIKEDYRQSLTIEATSINYNKGIKTLKSRSFSNMTLIDILRSIARENNLKTKIDFRLSNSIEYIEQVNESDSALCHRLANSLFCDFSIKNDTLIFLDKDREFDRHTYSLNADDCIRLSLEYFDFTKYGSIELAYTGSEGETRIIKVGDGEPVFKTSATANDDTHALQIATSKLKTLNSKSIKGDLEAIGEVMFAGGYLELNMNNKMHKFLITQINHNIDSKSWNMKIYFE